MKHQDPKRWNLRAKVHYVLTQENEIFHWHLLLLGHFSFLRDLFSTTEIKRCTSFYERTLNVFENKPYGQLDITLCDTSFHFQIFRIFSGPLGCAAFCVTFIEYGGNRRNALWDLVIGYLLETQEITDCVNTFIFNLFEMRKKTDFTRGRTRCHCWILARKNVTWRFKGNCGYWVYTERGMWNVWALKHYRLQHIL